MSPPVPPVLAKARAAISDFVVAPGFVAARAKTAAYERLRAEAIEMDDVIDFVEARRRRQMRELRAWIDKSLPDTLNMLGEVEMLLKRRSLSEREANVVADFLIKAMRLALHGQHVRTWSASLLEKLGRVAPEVLSAENRRSVEVATTALKAFDAVASQQIKMKG